MASKLIVREIESDTGVIKLGGTSELDLSSSTDFVDIPAGTTDQRGIPSEGATRWNYDYNTLEYYNGSVWKKVQKPKVIEDIVKSGLMIHLDPEDERSYSGIDNKWYDLTPNRYDFTLTGNYKYEVHRGAKCFNFDGGYSDVNCAVRVGGVSQNIGQECTINVVYCSINNQAFNGCSRIFSCGENNGTNLDYSTYFTLASCDQSKHGLWRGGGPTGFYPTTSIQASGDPWRIVTFSWTANGTAKVYVNGVLENSGTAGSAFNTAGISRMAVSMNAALNIEHARSRVGMVLMYDRQLTDAEVLQNYNALNPRFNF